MPHGIMTLHEYQRHAVAYALDRLNGPHHGAGLFLEPGLGKTLVSIAVMDILHAADPTTRFLVVAPSLVARNSWPDELEQWRGMHRLDWAVACGTPKQRLAALDADATVTVINQENIAWLDRTLREWPYTHLIVDELGGYKNPNSQRFRILRRRRRRMRGCLGLTGTPAVHDMLDLWAETLLIDNGLALGSSIVRYREEWFQPDRWMNRRIIGWREKPGSRRLILERLEPFCLSMSARDNLPGLPERLDVREWLDMPRDTRDAYERLRRDMLAETPEGVTVTAANAGVLTGKLSQLTSGCLYPDSDHPDEPIAHYDDVKLDRLDGIVRDADGPLLVFYGYRDELDRMRARIPGLREIHEDHVLEDWRAGRVPVLAAQPAAAKYGLNIQAGGHEIAWTCLPWSFDDFRQACGRLHRQGQTRPVNVHLLMEEDTVDRMKLLALNRRMSLHDAVMGALKGC